MDRFSDERKCGCCFSGHRRLTKDELEKAVSDITEIIPTLVGRGITRFYAGGAIGFDLAAAVTVINHKAVYPDITLVLALPCRSHMSRWTSAERKIFEKVIARADDVVYVSEEYDRGCMQRRNIYMVDKSSVCVCWLSASSGGTYNTVAYAKKSGIEVINLSLGYRGEQLGFDFS